MPTEGEIEAAVKALNKVLDEDHDRHVGWETYRRGVVAALEEAERVRGEQGNKITNSTFLSRPPENGVFDGWVLVSGDDYEKLFAKYIPLPPPTP